MNATEIIDAAQEFIYYQEDLSLRIEEWATQWCDSFVHPREQVKNYLFLLPLSIPPFFLFPRFFLFLFTPLPPLTPLTPPPAPSSLTLFYFSSV